LLQQPEVNATKKATLIGHSEGTVVATRMAIDNPDKVKNIVLMGAIALNIIKDNFYYSGVFLPISYAQNVLDKNHTGLLLVNEALKDPVFLSWANYIGKARMLDNPLPSILNPKNNSDEDSAYISINNELKPALVRQFEEYIKELNANQSSSPIFHKKCDPGSSCPIWARSQLTLPTNLGVIGNVSSNIGILILEGEYDAVQQAFLLQQRLSELNHPDHLLITYPNLGHGLYISNQWLSTQPQPIPQYVLADLYSWLEAHSGLSHPYVATANTSSSSR
jgi:pimeloyl-ACP methyl ester carboxylesterase